MNYKKKTVFLKKFNTIKHLVLLAIFLIPLLSISQIKPYGEFEPSIGDPARPELPALCSSVNGVNVTTTGTTPTEYFAPTLPNPCLPSAAYDGFGKWTDAIPNGFITYTFSQPLTSAVISYSVVNGDAFGHGQDVGAITTNSSGTTTLSNPCGLNISGNVISPNYLLDYSDVRIQVSSNCPFTTITLVNVGGESGWVQGNPCNFVLTRALNCLTYSPILSQTSLSNVCPNTTASLSSITANNNPNNCNSNFSLTWHTSATATATNILSSINNVVAGTYYASFYNSIANCYSPTKPVVVTINSCTTDIKIIKTINNPRPTVGSNVTFTITVTNIGPGSATNVVVNDVLPSGYTFVSATPSVGTWSAPNWTISNFANGANATLNIVATVKPAGNYKNTATVTANQADPVLSNNTSSVTPNIIYAAADNFTSTTIISCSGGMTASVLSNDMINGVLVTSSQVTTSIVNSGGLTGLTINNQGIINVPQGNAIGTYTVTYRICQTAVGFTTNCSQAIVTIKIGNAPIIAVNNNFSSTPINTLSGGQTPSVLTNDTVNGAVATSTNVVTSFVSVTPSITPTPTINLAGIITIPAGTTIGTYTLVYQIAQVGCLNNFTTASVTIVVNEQTIITPTIVAGIRANSIVSLSDTQADGKIIIAGYFTTYNNVPCYGIARLMTDLTLDPTFNIIGPLPLNQLALDLKVVKNAGPNFDKILVVGNFDGFNGGTNGRRIIRLTKDGNVDTTFNTGALAPGTTLRGVSGSNSQIRTCYIYPDTNPNGTTNINAGKILLGGMFNYYNGYNAIKLVRLSANGDYEFGSFNTNINTVITTAYDPLALPGLGSTPDAIVTLSDGSVVLGGYFNWYSGYPNIGRLMKLSNTGVIDLTFKNNIGTGLTFVDVNPPSPTGSRGPGPHATKMFVQPDGKIIIGGEFTHFNNVSRNNIVRIMPTGAIDATFVVGTGFKNDVPHPQTGTYGMVRDFAYEPYNPLTPAFTQGRLYVGGDFDTYKGTAVKTIMRINLLDGNNNALNVGTGPNGTVWTVKRQGDQANKIIIGGQFTDFAGTPALNVTRILPSGFQAKGGTIVETYISEPEIDLFADNETTDVLIYPNPSSGVFNIILNNFVEDKIDVKVYSSIGQVVYQKNTSANELKSLDLSDLPKGNYFISFSDGVKSTRKIIAIK
jgi:uncharacterized repeat protein (TIGR01451 family)/uncharacterized delta-60 repeat protein